MKAEDPGSSPCRFSQALASCVPAQPPQPSLADHTAGHGHLGAVVLGVPRVLKKGHLPTCSAGRLGGARRRPPCNRDTQSARVRSRLRLPPQRRSRQHQQRPFGPSTSPVREGVSAKQGAAHQVQTRQKKAGKPRSPGLLCPSAAGRTRPRGAGPHRAQQGHPPLFGGASPTQPCTFAALGETPVPAPLLSALCHLSSPQAMQDHT